MTARRLRLAVQALAALAALALAPAGWIKATLLAAIWLIPHGQPTVRELWLFAGANALFVVMDLSAVRAGLFAFSHPSALGLATYEPIMWGGYLLHVRGFWRRDSDAPERLPAPRFVAVSLLAVMFAACFPLVRDARTLFVATSAIVVAGAMIARTRSSLACAAHMALLGAAVELVGVTFGEWSYPREAAFTIPLWFSSMWAGVGLFFASLVFPFVTSRSQPKAIGTWKKAFLWLPSSLRRRIVLRRVTNDPRLRGVRFGVVASRHDALAAASLVHDAYVGRGVVAPHPTGVHVSPLSASPCSWAFLATLDGVPIGTISMVVDSDAGLPMEKVYSREIGELRASGAKVAEVGAFAVAREFRGTGLVFPLMWTMWRLALEVGVERFVAAVHPDAAWFYSDLLAFSRFGDTRTYPGLDASALAVALVSPSFGEIEGDYTRLFAKVWPAGHGSGAPGSGALSPRRAARQALMRARPDVIPRRPSLLGEVTATMEGR